jgi:hypothetical protein
MVTTIANIRPRVDRGERCHDATVAQCWAAARGCTTKGEQKRAIRWRDHVIATREERIARLNAKTFTWPAVGGSDATV